MKSTLFSTLVLFFLANLTFGQDLAINWQNNIGGTDLDVCYYVKRTPDGGYVLGCYSGSNISEDKSENSIGGSLDFWVIKLDANGIIEWENTIGGPAFDPLFGIEALEDGTIVIAGESKSGASIDKTIPSNGGSDYWILKLDSTGNILWQNAFGGSANDIMRGFAATADGGFLMTGHSSSGISGDKTEPSRGGNDYWVVKVDSEGQFEWDKTLGGSESENSWSVTEATDGSIFVGGFSDSPISGDKTEGVMGNVDIWIVKLSHDGNLIWENTIGGDGSDLMSDILPSSENGAIIGGRSNSNISGDKTDDSNGSTDVWLLEIDSEGSIVWQKTIGGSNSEGTQALVAIPGTGYLIASDSLSPVSGDKTEDSFGFDYWMIKVDQTGNILDQNTIQATETDVVLGVDLAHESGYVVVGYGDSDIGLDKNEDGQGYFDIWVLKLDLPLSVDQFEDSSISVFPNPASEHLSIISNEGQINRLRLHNMLGQEVYTSNGRKSSEYQVVLNQFAKGVYLLTIETDTQTLTKRIVVK